MTTGAITLARGGHVRQNMMVRHEKDIDVALERARDARKKLEADPRRAEAAQSYAKRHRDRSAWNDGIFATLAAASVALQRAEIALWGRVAKGIYVIEPVEEWVLAAIGDEVELLDRALGRDALLEKAFGTPPEYFVEGVVRHHRIDTAASPELRALGDLADDFRRFRIRMKAFVDPDRRSIGADLALLRDWKGRLDLRSPGLSDALGRGEMMKRYLRDVQQARSAASRKKRGRRVGSIDESIVMFRQGLVVVFAERGDRKPSDLDAAEIAIVRGFETGGVAAVRERWKKRRPDKPVKDRRKKRPRGSKTPHA